MGPYGGIVPHGVDSVRPSLSATMAPDWVLQVCAPSACVRAMTSWLGKPKELPAPAQ
jgi:hypothetical protein